MTATIISLIAQKGGVGKSTLSRGLATEIRSAKTEDGSEVDVLLVDMNVQQQTTMDWAKQRNLNKIKPEVKVIAKEFFSEFEDQLNNYDYAILDLPSGTTEETIRIAKASTIVIQPTSDSEDDVKPAIRLFHYLKSQGIDSNKLFYLLYKVDSEAETKKYRARLLASGYGVIDGSIASKITYKKATKVGLSIAEVDNRKNYDLKKPVKDILERIVDKT